MKLRFVMVLIIAPLLAMSGYFSWLKISVEQDRVAVTRVSVEHADQQKLINDLIHELQKERGYSAGFVASEGQNFRSELAQQLQTTNPLVPIALTQTVDLAAARIVAFSEAEADLEQIERFRRQVRSLDVTVPDVARYYTGIINNLLTVAYPIGIQARQNDLDVLQSTRALLAAAKEKAGLERAMGSTGLGSAFSPTIYRNLLHHGGAQIALLDETAKRLNSMAYADALYASPQFRAIQAARETIVEGRETGDFGTLTPPQWFQLSTSWIEVLRDAETKQTQAIKQLAAQSEAESRAQLRYTTLLVLSSVAIVGLFAIASFEWMIRRIQALTRVVYGFAKGDFTVWVPSINRKDEISQMARAIYHFKQETLALRREAEAMKNSDEADLNAKHSKVVALVTEGLAALAQADLTRQFHTPLDEGYDSIREDFNAAASRLRQVLGSIANTVAELDHSASRMNASALDLASRTNEQVDTIRTTTERVGALSSEVEVFGQEIISASSLAGSAREQATASAVLMHDAVSAMERIRTSSKEIGAIVSMIDDISFQTNLLALNAGVEAARAGPAGLGFAVVASEVRALAQRASQATMDIKALVDASDTHVREGGALVDRTGAVLEEISEGIMRVDDVLRRIANGSQSQVSNLKGLSSSMHVINDLATQNMTMADDTKSSSQDIAKRSEQLAALISDFKLEQGSPLRKVEGRAA